MESGVIPDTDITASSSFDSGNVGPHHGRWVNYWFVYAAHRTYPMQYKSGNFIILAPLRSVKNAAARRPTRSLTARHIDGAYRGDIQINLTIRALHSSNVCVRVCMCVRCRPQTWIDVFSVFSLENRKRRFASSKSRDAIQSEVRSTLSYLFTSLSIQENPLCAKNEQIM